MFDVLDLLATLQSCIMGWVTICLVSHHSM